MSVRPFTCHACPLQAKPQTGRDLRLVGRTRAEKVALLCSCFRRWRCHFCYTLTCTSPAPRPSRSFILFILFFHQNTRSALLSYSNEYRETQPRLYQPTYVQSALCQRSCVQRALAYIGLCCSSVRGVQMPRFVVFFVVRVLCSMRNKRAVVRVTLYH